ncbi:MAG: hypothetical protein ACOY9Y_13145 [Bacillota bacterium]
MTRRYLIAAIVLILGAFLITWGVSFFDPAPPQKKKLIPEHIINQEPQPEILRVADEYSIALASRKYNKAKQMGTLANSIMIDGNIRPYIERLYNSSGNRILFKSVVFERALLVSENMEDLVVLEILNYDHPVGNSTGAFLSFRIKKIGENYLVVSTRIKDKKDNS